MPSPDLGRENVPSVQCVCMWRDINDRCIYDTRLPRLGSEPTGDISFAPRRGGASETYLCQRHVERPAQLHQVPLESQFPIYTKLELADHFVQ